MDIFLNPADFQEASARQWVRERQQAAVGICVVYLIAVFSIQRFMRTREAFQLHKALRLWNFFLAVFSILGTVSITPEFLRTIRTHGLVDSYCHARDCFKGYNGYWMWLFYVSKVVELGDTIFLVLRKRPLMFLHWYHHVLTTTYAFMAYPEAPGFNRWGPWMNYAVHSLMYSYYFLRASGFKVPSGVAQMITASQIAQFIISLVLLVHIGYIVLVGGTACDFHLGSYALATFMSLSYLVLFVNFFIQAYSGGKARKKQQ